MANGWGWGKEELAAEQARSLAQKEQAEAALGSPWRRYMSGGGAKGEGTHTRHMDELERTHAQQLAAAEAYYAGATAPSNIHAGQARGQALQSSLGGLAGGGLGAREAIYGAGAGAYGAGLEGTQAGSQARMSAADAWMSAQADRARYDMAIAAAFQQRQQARDQARREAEAAKQAREEAERAAAMQAGGAAIGAGASAMAASGSEAGQQQNEGYGGSKYST
jgi:hypothetical protein